MQRPRAPRAAHGAGQSPREENIEVCHYMSCPTGERGLAAYEPTSALHPVPMHTTSRASAVKERDMALGVAAE